MRTFVEGETIEFKRFSGPRSVWETGTYSRVCNPGWHCVKDAIGLRPESPIPNRRIRKAQK